MEYFQIKGIFPDFLFRSDGQLSVETYYFGSKWTAGP